jgi:hypothetical protein
VRKLTIRPAMNPAIAATGTQTKITVNPLIPSNLETLRISIAQNATGRQSTAPITALMTATSKATGNRLAG